MVEHQEDSSLQQTIIDELQERGRVYQQQLALSERALEEARQRKDASRDDMRSLSTLAMVARARVEGFSEATAMLMRGLPVVVEMVESLATGEPETAEAAPSVSPALLDRGPSQVADVEPAGDTKLEVGARGEWAGNVGRQPEFDRVKDGRIRAQFFLAQHPDPDDREKTDWLRCYSLGRHAEALQKKGRLAGAEVLVRGTFQGVRTVPRRDGTTIEQQTIYCYGVRVVKGPQPGPGQQR